MAGEYNSLPKYWFYGVLYEVGRWWGNWGKGFHTRFKCLGLQGRIDHLDATLTVENGVATIRVDMVVGDITNPFEVIPNAMRLAQANGAHVLRLEGTIANPDLFRAMQFLARRYGGRFGSNGANEWIEITLIGK